MVKLGDNHLSPYRSICRMLRPYDLKLQIPNITACIVYPPKYRPNHWAPFRWSVYLNPKRSSALPHVKLNLDDLRIQPEFKKVTSAVKVMQLVVQSFTELIFFHNLIFFLI